MTTSIAELEAKVNKRWGDKQWDWTIGKCPEGWFYYCGGEENKWAHKGYALTLTAVLQAMLDIPHKTIHHTIKPGHEACVKPCCGLSDCPDCSNENLYCKCWYPND